MKKQLSDLARRIGEVADATDTSFAHLVGIARLDPKHDFRGADLSRVDFGAIDFTGYDFTSADLSFADLRQVRNISRACLDQANLDQAQMPSAEATKSHVDETFIARAASIAGKRTAEDNLWGLFVDEPLEARIEDLQKFGPQPPLFQSLLFEKASVIEVARRLIALPRTISSTSLIGWTSLRMRTPWRRFAIRTGRPDTKRNPWVKVWARPSREQHGCFDVAVPALSVRSPQHTRLFNLVGNTSMTSGTARFIANEYAQSFCAAINLPEHKRHRWAIAHCQPFEMADAADRFFGRKR